MTGEAFDRRLLAPLVLGAVLNPVNSSVIAVSLVPIGRALDARPAQTAWLVTALYISTAIGQPLTGRLVDRHGPRRLLLAGAGLTGVAGAIGAAAPSLGVLIGARVLLGLGTCAGYPAAMALIRREADRTGQDEPGVVLTVLAVSSQTIAVVGPPLGGVLIGAAGWRATLAINLPLALALLWLGARRLPREPSHPPAGRPATPAAAPAGRWRDRHAAILANGPLLRTYARQLLAGVGMYVVLYGYAQWMQDGRGLSAASAGALLLPLSGTAIAVSAATGRSTRMRTKLVVAALAQLAGAAVLLLVGAGTPVWLLLVVAATFGVPQGLANLANQAAVYRQADPAHLGASAGLLRTAFYSGAITASLVIGLAYGSRADTAGLHELALVIAATALALLVLTTLDRRLPGAPQPAWAAAASSSSASASRSPSAREARSSMTS